MKGITPQTTYILKKPIIVGLLLWVFLACPPNLFAQTDSIPQEQAARISFKQYAGWYFKDALHLLKSPVRWKAKDWGVLSGTVATAAFLYTQDAKIRDFVLTHKSPATIKTAHWVEPFGSGKYGAAGLAALYGISLIGKYPTGKRAALVAVESCVFSMGIVYPLKTILHRHRPYYSNDPKIWTGPIFPISDHRLSFPSGHSTLAFTLASSLSYTYRETRWLPPVLYTFAGLTALSRVHDDKHWASDIFVGSLIGHFVGRAIAKRHDNDKKSKLALSFVPALGNGRLLATVNYKI
jgi:membrane-associated phospholipid phosphatase